MKRTRTLEFTFRFPIKQVGENIVAAELPVGGNLQILNPEFCKEFNLSDAERDEAAIEVLRSIAIIK